MQVKECKNKFRIDSLQNLETFNSNNNDTCTYGHGLLTSIRNLISSMLWGTEVAFINW